MKEVTDDLEWNNISNEKYRTYTFIDNGKIFHMTIDYPVLINISKSGGHRILDAEDVAYYIPPKWVSITWETTDNVAFRF